MRKAIFTTIAALALTGCMHAEVARTDERTVFVSVQGSGLDSTLDVYHRVLREAAKATVAAGYDFFMIDLNANTMQHETAVLPGQAFTRTTVHSNRRSATATSETTYLPPTQVDIFKPGQDVRVRFLKASEVTHDMHGAMDARWILTHE